MASIQVFWQAMIHRHLPVKLVQRLLLSVGDRYNGDFRELLIEPYEIGDFETSMQQGYYLPPPPCTVSLTLLVPVDWAWNAICVLGNHLLAYLEARHDLCHQW
jgi:hypothetical protein